MEYSHVLERIEKALAAGTEALKESPTGETADSPGNGRKFIAKYKPSCMR